MRFTKKELNAYRAMHSVPAGAVLGHMLKRAGLTQSAVAQATGLLPQTVNQLVKGTRVFSVSTSMAVEAALGIGEAGFFYCHQARHKVFLEAARQEATPQLSLLSQSTFWDVDLGKVRWKGALSWALRRVLDYGSEEEAAEIVRFYGLERCRRQMPRLRFRNTERATHAAKTARLI